MSNQFEFSSFSGTVLFQWNRKYFGLISKALHLGEEKKNITNVRSYSAIFGDPFDCKILVYQNGRMNINGAKSLQSMQQFLDECIICRLIDQLPDLTISITEPLVTTNCTAKFSLGFTIDICALSIQLDNQFGIQSKANYVYLPKSVHQVQQVSVLLAKSYVKITKAHLIGDINLFKKYLQFVLEPFKLVQTPSRRANKSFSKQQI